MWNRHVSDEDLLRLADGEVSARQASRIQRHLEACWQCRARRAQLDRTVIDFVEARRDFSPPEGISSIEGPRAMFRARLSQLAALEAQTLWQRLRQLAFQVRFPAYGFLVVSIALSVGLVLYFGGENVAAVSVPDARLTPGATRQVTRDDVCPAPSVDEFYPIPATLAYRVFEKYSIRNPRPRSYEVDYLITPALGGADDIRNLWPQSYRSGEWTAHVKDALEDRLHELVCSGDVELSTAQRDIAMNWIDAYRKYFRTDRPLPDHVAFSIDPPWED